jgi:hypothetical protein
LREPTKIWTVESSIFAQTGQKGANASDKFGSEDGANAAV